MCLPVGQRVMSHDAAIRRFGLGRAVGLWPTFLLRLTAATSGWRRSLPRASLQEVPDLARTSEGRAAEVERLIAPTLADMGYDIVRVMLSGDREARLQVMIERDDLSAITLDDCAAASRAASAILDVEDPIAEAYSLEVSSPGMDRPLTRLADFARFAGRAARIELGQPLAGRRRFSGRLLGVEGEAVLLDRGGERFSLPFADLIKAKLIPTDEPIAARRRDRDP